MGIANLGYFRASASLRSGFVGFRLILGPTFDIDLQFLCVQTSKGHREGRSYITTPHIWTATRHIRCISGTVFTETIFRETIVREGVPK